MKPDMILFSHNININSQKAADPICLSSWGWEIEQMVTEEFTANRVTF